MTLGLFHDVDGFMNRGATLSPCGRYRFRLWREWGDPAARVAFIGLNPSTADATFDDPTIRKCIGFAKRWGFGAFEMLNLFAWRSTDPRALLDVPRSHADENEHIARCVRGVQCVVLSWGSHPFLGPIVSERAAFVRGILLGLTCPPEELRYKRGHLGINKDGQPKHPLYLPYETRFQEIA